MDEELRTLKSTECSTPQYIVNLRNYLPTLEEALRGVNGLEHLCSPDRVHFLAAKFDERTMYDWEYFRSKNSGTTYERFFKFLVDRYDASRTTIARLKSVSSNITNNTVPQTVNIISSGVNDTDCRKCRTWIARDTIYSCPGCGRGTAVGEKILHCLEHCGAFMSMNMNERSACVETAGWCPVHLLGTHAISECNSVKDDRFICEINK